MKHSILFASFAVSLQYITANSASQQATKSRIEGAVVRQGTGEPLPRARLTLSRSGRGAAPAVAAPTAPGARGAVTPPKVAIVLLRDAAVAQDANLTRVNVVVTEPSRDRKVRGLEKENFKVWEDDVAQEIVSMTRGRVDGEYVLAYKSTNSAKDGKWRNLRANIVLPKGLEGYYASSN